MPYYDRIDVSERIYENKTIKSMLNQINFSRMLAMDTMIY